MVRSMWCFGNVLNGLVPPQGATCTVVTSVTTKKLPNQRNCDELLCCGTTYVQLFIVHCTGTVTKRVENRGRDAGVIRAPREMYG